MSDKTSYEKLLSSLSSTYESAIARHQSEESSSPNDGSSSALYSDCPEKMRRKTSVSDTTTLADYQNRSDGREQGYASSTISATVGGPLSLTNKHQASIRRARKVRRRSPDDVASWAPSQEGEEDQSSESRHEASTIGARAKRRRRRRRGSKHNSNSKSGISSVGNEKTCVQHRYTDHSSAQPPSNFDASLHVQDSVPAKRLGGGTGAPFPMILHHMLELADAKGYSHIVSWQPHGRAFTVHDQKTFMSEVMPLYFQQSRFASFQRQLSLYGFLRLTRKGPDFGAYYHELCLRGKPFLCKDIARTRVKGYKVRQSSSPETEPDFYAMNFVDEKGRPVANFLSTKSITTSSASAEVGEQYSRLPLPGASSAQDSLTSLFDPEFLMFSESHKFPTTTSVCASTSVGNHVMSTAIPTRHYLGTPIVGLTFQFGSDVQEECPLYVDQAETVTSSSRTANNDQTHTNEGEKEVDIHHESEDSSPVNSKLMAFLSDVDLSSESGEDELLIDAV